MLKNESNLTSLVDELAERPTKLVGRNVWKVFGAHPERFFQDGRTPTAEEILEQGHVPANIDTNIEVKAGETFVLMGLSGSGKSTLLRCLAQLAPPTHGAILLDGENLAEMSEKDLREVRRKKMSMVFQHFALLPFRTVLQNIGFPLEVQGVPASQVESRAREALDLVGLSGFENRLPRELSGGQQQRVGIARSLVNDPDVWFLDEPFSALDPLIRLDLQEEVKALKARLQKTTVFVTHDLDEAVRLADRIAIMQDGRIIQTGTPEECVMNPATDYVRRFTASVSKIKVARIGSAMRAEDASLSADAPVLSASDLVSEQLRAILTSGSVFRVVNQSGKSVGQIGSADVVDLLQPAGEARS
jgi:glycine betaine/proline transport system ATP-binding protein